MNNHNSHAAATAGYMSIVMLSTAVPGVPAIATPPEVFEEILQVGVVNFIVTARFLFGRHDAC
jgi:hypothetical protein